MCGPKNYNVITDNQVSSPHVCGNLKLRC